MSFLHMYIHTLSQFEKLQSRMLRAPVFHPQGRGAESSREGLLNVRICCFCVAMQPQGWLLPYLGQEQGQRVTTIILSH